MYRITYERHSDITRQNFVDSLDNPIRFIAKLIGFEGAYLRFEGTATVEKVEAGKVIERASEDSAVWELMYFGKSGADKKY